MNLSAAYSLTDHRERKNDRYARAKYEITRRWIAPMAAPGMTLFNVGCGGGYFNALAYAMGLRVVACEPEAEAYGLAVASVPDTTVEVHNCGLREFAESNRQADFVVLHDVLEHIADDEAGVADLWCLTKSTGRVVISVPALQWLYGKHDEELGHFRRYTARSLTAVLQPRFNIVRMRYFGALSIPIALGFSRLMRRSYPRSAGDGSALARAYGSVCDFEVGVEFPIGTSILAEIAPKGEPSRGPERVKSNE